MKYLVGFLTFLIFIILSVIYINISSPVILQKQEKNHIKKHYLNQNIQIINKPKISYLFPARILFIKIDFKKSRYEIIYKLIIGSADKYALFNIKTILDSYNINYSLYKVKKSEIYIFFKSLEQANLILNLFKRYNFNIQIQKIKKRI